MSAISPREKGCCVELLWGRHEAAKLAASPAFSIDGVNVRRVYQYGGGLNAFHVSLILSGMADRHTMCAISRQVLASPSHISKIMGMDGLVLITTLDDKFVSVERIDEVKTTRSRNALFGTYMLSEDLFCKNIRHNFCIVHPSDVQINRQVLKRMRHNHGHTVNEMTFDPELEDIEQVYSELFSKATAVQQKSAHRRWQLEQNEFITSILSTLAAFSAENRVLRLDACMGSGKSHAIAMNMRSAPKVFQIRVVSTHSVAGLKHLMREMTGMGVNVEECDYKTSRDEENEMEELVSDSSIRRIASMIAAFSRLLTDPDSARPPVLGCIHHTLPVLIQIMKPLLNESCRLLYVQDESHEFRLRDTIAELVANPFIVTVQVSGTFYDSDLDLMQSFPSWCVTPYYQYTYKASIHDGNNVPLSVYLFDCPHSSTERRVQKLVDLLTLYPGTTIVASKSISEARSMLLGMRATSLGYTYMACVHSDMQPKNAHLDGAHSPEQAIQRVNANPSEPAVLITVRMARASIDIPSATNFVDFTRSSTSVDHIRQKEGRVLRSFSHQTADGETVQKTYGRYFVDRCQAEVVQHSKRIFGEDNICIYDIAGENIEEMIATSFVMRPCTPPLPRETASMQRSEYRLAFCELATEATKMIWSKKDRAQLSEGERWIQVPFLSACVCADLRTVVDDIVKVYHGKSGSLTLPDGFCYPPFASNANAGREHKNVNLKRIRLTPEEKSRLTKEHADPISDAIWNDIARASHSNALEQLKNLWSNGFFAKNGIVVKTPKFHGCDMSVDVDQICETELQDVVDGVFFKKDYLRWIMQRIKLKQMFLLRHPLYETYADLEEKRIARLRTNTTGITGQKRMHDFFS